MSAAQSISVTALSGLSLALAVGVGVTLLCRSFGQPAVVGEMAAGICLGPSLLGLFPGNLPAHLFPPEVRPYLSVVAQVGLLLFMFGIGWEFDTRFVRSRLASAGTIWATSLAVPLVLGFLLARTLEHPALSTGGRPVSDTGFALYFGLAMSITALPVLARIVEDQGLRGTRLGNLSLGLAAADDLLAWCMLAVVVALTNTGGIGGFLGVMGWSALYLAVLFGLVRPLLAAAATRMRSRHLPYAAPLIAAGVFLSAYTTAHIGIDAIFGAFMFGTAMPRPEQSLLQRAVHAPFESVSRLLMPVFFVVTGLSVDLTTLSLGGFAQAGLIMLVACVGKLGAVTLSARATGTGWRDATVIGALMNTRGVTELVLLSIGLNLGLLTVPLYSSMVLMALVTTALAAPVIKAVTRKSTPPAEAEPELLEAAAS
ncbi:cation:proton antiporter [Kitasatospora fiedleri]|uniref:cation:proton antiporter n=1 Tax=Kitasatospora fiedleri TaxID=2991545 RepID=UPI00249B7961|nr:cation:proton antiporter [Kitasatospora fiedleri]